NRALLEAGGEVIAYSDDDVLVDGGWLLAYGRLFAASPELAAATGTVVPAELEYRAQRLFEAYGGFLRGWQREWYRATGLEPAGKPWHHGAGRFGTGANMAFRRDLLSRLGGFDPALDVGTPSDGGGDLEMYFRVLQEGHALAYSPDAIVRHRHRRELHELERQLRQWGIGFGAFMERSLRAYPEERRAFRGVTRWWWGSYFPRRVLRSLLGRSGVPLRFAIGEAAGLLEGRRAFAKAVRFAAGVSASLPNEPVPGTAHDAPRDPAPERTSNKIAVRTLELTRPLRPLKELAGAAAVEGVVTMHGLPVARCRMVPEGGGVGVLQQRERIGEALGSSISKAEHQRALEAVREWVAERRLDRKERFEPSVSVVISTADRPD